MTTYPPDTSLYQRFKDSGNRYSVKCLATTDERGIKKCCDYCKREDHHKRAVSQGTFHEHHYVPIKNQSTIDTFYPHDFVDPNSVTLVTEDSLHDELAALVGRKNLSFATGASKEVYQLMLHSIQFGLKIANPGIKDSSVIAKQRFHTIGRDTLRTKMISVSDSVHRIAMKKFSEVVYAAVSIDAGALHSQKNLDFVLENPHAGLRPYPAFTVSLTDSDAPAYVIAISQGLNAINKYGIRIAAVVCDGLLAQKKAFDIGWEDSIRNRAKEEWLQQVLFIPCLCHRVSNAYKYNITHDVGLTQLVTTLYAISTYCRTNVKEIGAICPLHIDTRWICDYDILFFIRSRKEKLVRYGPIPQALDDLFRICVIFRALTLILEDPKRPHYESFHWLECAILALRELSVEIPMAKSFEECLSKYTLSAEDGGCWSLSYILTRAGQLDFHRRANTGVMTPKAEGYLKLFSVKGPKNIPDELQETEEAALEQLIAITQEHEAPDDEAEPPGQHSHLETGLNDPIVLLPSLAPQGQTQSAIETDEDYHVRHSNKKDHLTQAREYLLSVLRSLKFGDTSAKHIVAIFNTFADWRPDQIPISMMTNQDDFNWSGQRLHSKEWSPLADIAMRLHCCPCSEAECERTISAQRLILTSRRLHSKKRTIDARLTLMRALES